MTNTLNVNALAAVHDGWKGTINCARGQLDTAEHILECVRTAGLRRALWMTAATRLSGHVKRGRPQAITEAKRMFKAASVAEVKMVFTGRDCDLMNALAKTMGVTMKECRKEMVKMAGRHLEVSHLRMARARPTPITGTLF